MRDGCMAKILITTLIVPLVNGGLLGYGTGEGSCAAYPFRCHTINPLLIGLPALKLFQGTHSEVGVWLSPLGPLLLRVWLLPPPGEPPALTPLPGGVGARTLPRLQRCQQWNSSSSGDDPCRRGSWTLSWRTCWKDWTTTGRATTPPSRASSCKPCNRPSSIWRSKADPSSFFLSPPSPSTS